LLLKEDVDIALLIIDIKSDSLVVRR